MGQGTQKKGQGTRDTGQVNGVPYLPNTDEDRTEMLRFIGAQSIDELFADIPVELREKALLNLPPALSEPELMRHIRSLASQNIPVGDLPDEPVPRPSSLVPFLGAGIYDHYIPPCCPTHHQPQRVLHRLHALPSGSVAGNFAGDL
jgi:glycine cleavage system pyridoxal-binding protein P